jgi:hypothetical protein
VHVLAPSVPSDLRAILASLGIALPEASGFARRSHAAPRLLGDALSLQDSVRLSGELARGASRPAVRSEPDTTAASVRAELMDQASERLHALRERLDARYATAFEGRQGLHDAARTHALLIECGAIGGDARARRRASTSLAAAICQFFSAAFANVQRELPRLKHEITSQLRDRRAVAERLLRLDAVLDPAIGRQLELRQQALLRVLEQRCAADFERAIAALEQAAGPARIAAWFARGGVAAVWLDASLRLAHVLLDLQWRSVAGLIDAACSEPAKIMDAR